ncbi:hypothetical protein D3C73_1638510 [compost metagenome]
MRLEFIVQLPADQPRKCADGFGDALRNPSRRCPEIGMVRADMLPRSMTHDSAALVYE